MDLIDEDLSALTIRLNTKSNYFQFFTIYIPPEYSSEKYNQFEWIIRFNALMNQKKIFIEKTEFNGSLLMMIHITQYNNIEYKENILKRKRFEKQRYLKKKRRKIKNM